MLKSKFTPGSLCLQKSPSFVSVLQTECSQVEWQTLRCKSEKKENCKITYNGPCGCFCFKMQTMKHSYAAGLWRWKLIYEKWLSRGNAFRSFSSVQFSSIQFSRSVVSDPWQPHESQHARPPCPSPTPRVYSDSCLSSRWCHPAISSSVVPFFSCPQSLPASGSFPMSQLVAWGDQSIGVSALASVLPKKDHPGLISFRMDWLDLLAV